MIKKLIDYRRRARLAIASCEEKSNYLEPGEYFLDPELRYIYRNDSETIDFIETVIKENNHNLSHKRDIKYKVKRILAPNKLSLLNNPEKEDFRGSIYLLSNDTSDEKDVKIFDIKTSKVLTVYVEQQNLKKKVEDYRYFGEYFNIPEITEYDFDKKTSVEELVSSKPKNIWNELDYSKVIETIFSSYEQYYKSSSKNNNYGSAKVSDMLTELKDDETLNDLVCQIEKEISKELITDDIPTINQHGDLWLYNTMLGENGKVYFIDWEHSGEYFLFYDLFWWMQNEALYNNNFSYLERYIMGKYDVHFKEMFDALNYNFNERLRKDYVYIFMLELLYKRILNNSENIKKTANALFSKLFVQIQEVNCSQKVGFANEA